MYGYLEQHIWRSLKKVFPARIEIADSSSITLDGCEVVSSVKEAPDPAEKVRNPAVTFSEAVRNGAHTEVSDEDYRWMLDTIKYISSLWHYQDEPEDSPPPYEMNVLMLLANAIEALSQLNTQYQMPFLGESPTQ